MKRILSRLILTICALLCSALASAQGVRYDGITFSPSGRPVAASVAVCTSPGLTTTAAQVIGNTAILTMSSNPITAGFAANMQIAVSGFTGGDTFFNVGTLQPFSSTVTITAVSATTITYPLTHANAAASTNGSVFQMGNVAQACAPLASIFSDSALAVPTTQPGFVSSGIGNFGFFASSGSYAIQFYGSGVTTYLQPLTIQAALNANNTFTGNNTFAELNNLVFVDGFKFTTIQAAYNSLSAGQCVALKPGYTETLTSSLTFGTNNTCLIALGSATITLGAFQVIVSPGVVGFSINSLSPFSPNDNGTAVGGLVLTGYTGTAEALKVGAAGSDTKNIDIRNTYISLTSAGAGAIGLGLYRTQRTYEEHVSVFLSGTVNNQIGFLRDGKDGTQTHSLVVQPFCFSGTGSATGQIGHRWTANASNSGGAKFITGGDTSLLANAGSIGLDVLSGDTLMLNNPSIENVQTGLHVGSNTQGAAVYGYARFDSSVTPNIITFDASTQNNYIWTQNSGTVNDSGAHNYVTTIGSNGFNSRFNPIVNTSTDWILYNAAASIPAIDVAAAGQTYLSALGSSGQISINAFANSGTGGLAVYSGGGSPALVWTVDGSGRMKMLEAAAPSGTAGNHWLWGDSADHLLKYNPNNAGEQHVPQVFLVGATYTNPTTTFSNLTNMTFTAKASTNYTMSCKLYLQGSATTAGPKFQLTGPASPTSVTLAVGPFDPIAKTTTNVVTGAAFASANTTFGTIGALGVNYEVDVTATIRNGANAGAVALQAAANGAGTLTVQADSSCRVQ